MIAWRRAHNAAAALTAVGVATGLVLLDRDRDPWAAAHRWLTAPLLVALPLQVAAGWRLLRRGLAGRPALERLNGAFARVAGLAVALLVVTGVALFLAPTAGWRTTHRILGDVLLPALGAHALLAAAIRWRRRRRRAKIRGELRSRAETADGRTASTEGRLRPGRGGG